MKRSERLASNSESQLAESVLFGMIPRHSSRRWIETVHLTDWIDHVFQQRTLLLMGHAQRREDLNLGLGWLYYAFARMLRPSVAVVIGSYRGFAPLVFARALADNYEG